MTQTQTKILVDTSIWSRHLRSPNSHLVALLKSERVVMHPFVIAELSTLLMAPPYDRSCNARRHAHNDGCPYRGSAGADRNSVTLRQRHRPGGCSSSVLRHPLSDTYRIVDSGFRPRRSRRSSRRSFHPPSPSHSISTDSGRTSSPGSRSFMADVQSHPRLTSIRIPSQTAIGRQKRMFSSASEPVPSRVIWITGVGLRSPL